MDTYFQAMKNFEAANSWVATMNPMDNHNQKLNEFICNTIQTLPWMQQFLNEGTVLGMETFLEELKIECPKLILGTLNNLYNYLRVQDSVKQNKAVGVIEWYRGNGWIFPPISD